MLAERDANVFAQQPDAAVKNVLEDQLNQSEFVPEAFYDVINGELIDDPVLAEDGRTYSRESITKWIEQCRTQNNPITSPWTRVTIP